MDFKQHAQSGRFYLLEINARYNLWHHLGAVNGVNLPQVAYEYLIGGAVQVRLRARTRYRWLKWSLDWRAALELHRARELTLGGWLRSLARPTVHHTFLWRDPGPFLKRLARRLSRWRA
jgi:predicted ATP-grasp superfamily ATP-dependent carboligase